MNKWIRTTIYCLAALTLLWILVIVADRQIDSHDLPGDPNCVAIYQLEDELNEPNEDDLENARKLGNLLINYADYAQGKIDCNEYVRRGTLKEQAWNWSEPNDQTIYYHRVEECESRGCFEDIAAPKGTALPASEGELYWQEIKDKKDKLFIYTDSHGWVEVKDLHIYEPNLSETTYYDRVDEDEPNDVKVEFKENQK